MADEDPICERCNEPIELADLVTMARQVETTAMTQRASAATATVCIRPSTLGVRRHPQVGVWRGVTL